MKLHFDVKFLSRQATKVRLATFTVLALVSSFTAFTAPMSSWAAEVNHFKIKGLVAIAFFDGFEGCIVTNVGVRAIEGDGPGKPGNGSEVELFVEQLDTCQDVLVLSAESTTAVSASEFQIDKKLESARLTKTVELTDSISGNSFDVSVDLTWTATSQPEVTRNRFYIRTAGRISHEQDKGTLREASTAGTVSSGPTNFLQNITDTFADLQSVNDGFKEVIKF
jgi:hypothetical protein